MLRLVHLADDGQETGSSRKKFVAGFTPVQCARIRALLRNLRQAYGSWSCLAEVTGYAETTLSSTATAPHRATYSLVFQVARAAGMTVDEALSPISSVAGACPTCGRRGAK